MLDPILCSRVASAQLLNPLWVGVLKHLIIVVLRSPHVHFEGKTASKGGSRLELLNQCDIVRICQQLLRESFDCPAQGKPKCFSIESDVVPSSLVQKSIYAREIQGFRIFESFPKAAVQCKFRGHGKRRRCRN